MNVVILLLLFIHASYSQASFMILHYTETSGFDHNTRQNSLAMFQLLGAENDFTVDNDNDGTSFNSLATLQQYSVIVFSNTSGDNILDSIQMTNFQNYVNGGGSVLGIHAASDTYRHSTANGSNTGTWDWYAELLGASVQQNPNHVSGTPAYNMNLIGNHFSTANLPNPWNKNEEYYYWEGGYFNGDNITVLEVEETVGPNGQVNSYDSARPMSWARELPAGGRVFYTALGHVASDYLNDQNFINHVRDGLRWAAGKNPTGLPQAGGNGITPVLRCENISLYIEFNSWEKGTALLVIYDLSGKIVKSEITFLMDGSSNVIPLNDLHDGVYLVKLTSGGDSMIRKFMLAR